MTKQTDLTNKELAELERALGAGVARSLLDGSITLKPKESEVKRGWGHFTAIPAQIVRWREWLQSKKITSKYVDLHRLLDKFCRDNRPPQWPGIRSPYDDKTRLVAVNLVLCFPNPWQEMSFYRRIFTEKWGKDEVKIKKGFCRRGKLRRHESSGAKKKAIGFEWQIIDFGFEPKEKGEDKVWVPQVLKKYPGPWPGAGVLAGLALHDNWTDQVGLGTNGVIPYVCLAGYEACDEKKRWKNNVYAFADFQKTTIADYLPYHGGLFMPETNLAVPRFFE